MAAAVSSAPPLKCFHKGCGKSFTDPDEECHYHPGAPEFHEGQKGWRCCKPRVLTFDEFLAIPPCTVGKHSAVDDTRGPDDAKKEKQAAENAAAAVLAENKAKAKASASTSTSAAARAPTTNGDAAAAAAAPPPKKDETEYDDDPSLPIPDNATCRRRGCNAQHTPPRDVKSEKCIYHPGQPIFHEGSKGWSCCKRRVLEFDQFLKIEGCKEREGHQFVGRKKEEGEEELLDDVRSDFYQTETTLTFSLYLKNIDRDAATVTFPDPTSLAVDLPTSDNKRFKQTMPLYAAVDVDKCKWKIMKTKLEGVLVKQVAGGWPTLRKDERGTGERIQVGKARMV